MENNTVINNNKNNCVSHTHNYKTTFAPSCRLVDVYIDRDPQNRALATKYYCLVYLSSSVLERAAYSQVLGDSHEFGR